MSGLDFREGSANPQGFISFPSVPRCEHPLRYKIMISKLSRTPILLCLQCLIGGPAWAQFDYTWEAISGLTPDQAEPAYSLVLSGDAPSPALEPDLLRIATESQSENAYYIQFSPIVDTSLPFTLEFELRLVSGFSATNIRGPVMVFITIANATGTLLVIDLDKVFFLDGAFTPGAQALVDTDDISHHYRLEHDGSGGFTLFYDSMEILSTAAFVDSASHGTQMRIGWGEASTLAFGESEWRSFSHNANDGIFRSGFETLD